MVTTLTTKEATLVLPVIDRGAIRASLQANTPIPTIIEQYIAGIKDETIVAFIRAVISSVASEVSRETAAKQATDISVTTDIKNALDSITKKTKDILNTYGVNEKTLAEAIKTVNSRSDKPIDAKQAIKAIVESDKMYAQKGIKIIGSVATDKNGNEVDLNQLATMVAIGNGVKAISGVVIEVDGKVQIVTAEELKALSKTRVDIKLTGTSATIIERDGERTGEVIGLDPKTIDLLIKTGNLATVVFLKDTSAIIQQAILEGDKEVIDTYNKMLQELTGKSEKAVNAIVETGGLKVGGADDPKPSSYQAKLALQGNSKGGNGRG
jgi:hypothetical protein